MFSVMGASERDVVVEVAAAGSALATSVLVASLLATGLLVTRLRGTISLLAEHGVRVHQDLARVAIVARLVLPLARGELAGDEHLGSLAAVVADDLRQLAERDAGDPLGFLLALAGGLVLPRLADADAE